MTNKPIFETQVSKSMRLMSVTIAVFLTIAFAPSSNASERAYSAADGRQWSEGAGANGPRCRCVERRWNGSCKLRVCRDRW